MEPGGDVVVSTGDWPGTIASLGERAVVGWVEENVTVSGLPAMVFVNAVLAVAGAAVGSTGTAAVLTSGCAAADTASVAVDEDNTESNQVLASMSVSFSSSPPDASTPLPTRL